MPQIKSLTPINVQPWDILRARYPAAIATVIDQQLVVDRRELPPSSRAEHVFDTPDGIRLIVSLERWANDRLLGIHVSASWHEGAVPTMTAAIAGVRADPAAILQRLLADAQAVFVRLSGQPKVPTFLGLTDGGIPHFRLLLPD